MIDKETYLKIARKHGYYASWAIWAKQGNKPKSNIGDLSIFNINSNPQLLSVLNPNVIMVGLNFSRDISGENFANFHDKRSKAQDYKIRYAFKDTKYYGAYMTDIIKDIEEVISGKVMSFLKENPQFVKQNISIFKQEIRDLKSENPTIVAFGDHSYSILNKHLKNIYKIIKVYHYSMRIGMDNYRKSIQKII